MDSPNYSKNISQRHLRTPNSLIYKSDSEILNTITLYKEILLYSKTPDNIKVLNIERYRKGNKKVFIFRYASGQN